MSTSGRIHGEFLRLLYILAHRRTLKYFADMGDDEPGTDAFTWRRSQYFWKHKAAIGFGNAALIIPPPWSVGSANGRWPWGTVGR